MSLYEGRLKPTLIKKTMTISPNASLLEARDLMARFRITRLVVKDNKNKPIGILTEKDLSRGIYSLDAKLVTTTTVGDCMTKNLIVAKTDQSISYCAKLMEENDISSIVIVNSDNTLAGLVTKSDIIQAFLIYDDSRIKISDIMTRKVITVRPDDSLYLVESVLFNNKISRVVVEQNKKPIGIITYRDFFPVKLLHPGRQLSDPEERKDTQWVPWLNQFNVKSLDHALTFQAKDIMTPNPLTILSNEYASTVALLMLRHGISGIPVTKSGNLVGIVTKKDIVKVVAMQH